CPGSTTVDLVVEVCTGIDDQQVQRPEAWPNPFTDELTLRMGNRAAAQVELLDASGRLIASFGRQPAEGLLVLDQNGALPGAYLIRIWPDGSAPQVLRVLKL
ncbi:MAG: T9SS type A sorting domain-containing protein, partial [Flavobacteriales bacterium]